MNLIYLMDLILFLIYKISDFEYIIKKHETVADNLPVQIYVNKIKNRIVFKIKTNCKLELLPEETMQFYVAQKIDINQNKDGEIVPKTAEATGDLIGNKIAEKITSLGKSKNIEKEKR